MTTVARSEHTADRKAASLESCEREGTSRRRLLAELGLSPAVPNATTVQSFAKDTFGEFDLTDAVAIMTEQAGAVQQGNLAGLEATLTAQVAVLDTIFNEMARRAAANLNGCLSAADIYLRLGLKAQGQCRATIQTLAEMKNPQPVTFVRQANVAHGPQQVNNGAGPDERRRRTRARKSRNLATTELLE